MRTVRIVAATVSAGAAVLGLAGCGSSGGTGVPGSTVTTAPSSSAPSSPAPSTPSDGTPSSSGGIRITIPCRSQVLSAQIAPDSAGRPQLRLTNTGVSACSIAGYVTIVGTDSTGESVAGPSTIERRAEPGAPKKLILGAQQHAWAGLALSDGGRCTGAAVTPPVDTRPVTARVLDARGSVTRLTGCPTALGVLTGDASTAHL